ncbi:hypothetical protein QBC43DRAFT_68217 [Cladorrhinum sp. PSN259]|nr:hypothetical protein QBC43DRAFT_68217 [Cladorrhinum sp. PSN259]
MGRIFDNFKSKWASWLYAIFSLFITFASYMYVKVMLIDEASPPPYLRLPPGRTILVVNIFAHIVAFLIWDQMITALEAWRWALASRQSQGLPLGSFLALSRAAGPMAVASLMLLPRPGIHLFYCAKRLSFMGLAWALGIVLTSNLDFRYVYTPTGLPERTVYAGVAPLTPELVDQFVKSPIPAWVANFFWLCFTYGLLSDNRFAIPIQPISCSGPECRSFFLPGGAAYVRDRHTTDQRLIGDTEIPWDSETAIRVQNAPGYHLEFHAPPSGWTFNRESDCVAVGQTEDEGLYICLANHGTDLIAGWSVCPFEIWFAKSCFTNTTWQDDIDQITAVTMQNRLATTAYSGANFSILSVDKLSSPKLTKITANEVMPIVTKILAPMDRSVNASHPNWVDNASTYAVHYALGTGLRYYKKYFPGLDILPLDILRNFISVFLQFSTGAIYLGVGAPFPPELNTTATVVSAHYRAMADPWVLRVYGAVSLFLGVWAMALLALACIVGRGTPTASKFPEIDLISRYPGCPEGEDEELPEKGVGKSVEEHDLSVMLVSKVKEPRGVLTKIRALASGSDGVLELISTRRIRFGLPDTGESAARAFITNDWSVEGKRLEDSEAENDEE